MRTMNAVDVLNAHAAVAERMQRPSRAMESFIGWHLRRTLESQWAAGIPTQGTFHPVIPIGSTKPPGAAEGAEMARLIGRGLSRAVTYQVTAEMMQVIRYTFTHAMEEIERLDDREIPSPAGFAWLDEPWEIPASDGAFQVRALSWEFTEVWAVGDVVDPEELLAYGTSDTSTLWPCVRVCLWRHDDDSGPFDRSPKLGPLTITHTALMPFRLRFIEPEREGIASAQSLLGLLHLLWIFLGMEITSSEKRGIPAGTRKHARRSLRHAEVRVVTLRKVRGVTEPEPGQSREVFWSCRWPVQGHYRHRERPADGHHAIPATTEKHCAVCGQDLTWVQPYLKGPAGKPLRNPDRTLMKLAR